MHDEPAFEDRVNSRHVGASLRPLPRPALWPQGTTITSHALITQHERGLSATHDQRGVVAGRRARVTQASTGVHRVAKQGYV
jgi:hypothetical protein